MTSKMRYFFNSSPAGGARGLACLCMLGAGHHSFFCFSVKLLIEKLFAKLLERSAALENHAFALLSLLCGAFTQTEVMSLPPSLFTSGPNGPGRAVGRSV